MSYRCPLWVMPLIFFLSLPVQADEQTLRVLAWPGYADSDVVAGFEKRFNVKVEVTMVGSDEVLRSKMTENQGGNFDVIAANTAEVHYYADQGLLQPLRPERIANTSRQLPRFRDYSRIPDVVVDGRIYAIPYVWSDMGLIYDRKQFSQPPESITSMWDPKFRGSVLAFNTSNHNFSLASLSLGGDPFRIEAADFPRVSEQLIALRRNVLTFYSLPEEAAELFRRHNVALLFANYGRQQLKQLRDAGIDVGYVIPREGALAWLDCWAISRGARDPVLANVWINYMLEPGVSNLLTERQGLPNTLQEPNEGGPSNRLIWLRPVEDDKRRTELWQRIVSGERPPLVQQ
ncbi:extracellular solute-binding protein [Pseudomonas moorei]|uniref:Putative spermidine/putrescine transport system substrate-binding protein n=2 Tax=Pseudomonas moorei TaxID=395599 RepID=A0A1H0YRT3_9PSED|nr:extracellular solute-binding protein [Pseudomonas moorei]SDQ17566.1 putative spermidine/putrescine transport system substrate-binding protein [Pseudomonas moorei]